MLDLKLAPCCYGPFQVEQKVGEVGYRLRLPISSRIHPTFHVSCLKHQVKQSLSRTTKETITQTNTPAYKQQPT